ncbi:MAG: T9SS C-terminal target domain-containing protein [Bacteroidetes bacterium]|nr:T9SS C-terminal target domain-containing protein [Bacteroidota bacterium]
MSEIRFKKFPFTVNSFIVFGSPWKFMSTCFLSATKSITLLLLFIFFINAGQAQLLEVEQESVIVPNPGIPVYPGFPDGHISYFPINDSTYVHIWAGYESYISSGPDWMHQDSLWGMVLSKGQAGTYDNGGAWLYSVFPLDSLHWLGFYHAEDHEFAGYDNTKKIAWKSGAQCESFDGGKTWIKNGQFLTTWLNKPEKPTWGGTGDFSVIRDSANNRWLAYYVCPNGIGVAESKDPLGKPGTWFKLNNGSFSTPGVGGKGDALPFSRGKFAGGNPSLLFYKPLQVWFMVYHDWKEQGIYYSYSFDHKKWSDACLLLKNPGSPQRLWYPTLLSPVSDKYSNSALYLAYAQWDNVDFTYRNYRMAVVNVRGLTMPQFQTSNLLSVSDLYLTDTTLVNLTLYDATGKSIKVFYSEKTLPPGTYQIDLQTWMTRGLNYLVLRTENGTQVKKLMRL